MKAQNPSSDYEQVIGKRAEKIVASLGLSDPGVQTQMRDIISSQYKSLGRIHDEKNEQEAAIKREETVNRTEIDNEIKKLEDESADKIKRLHSEYLQKLSPLLSAQQVELVKDGMTYNVTAVTFNAYCEMLPQLTSEQKDQIMKWLKEAREQAMDAESSQKKHWWFGKYKGRITNYLATQGYDLKKAGEDWEKRRNAEKKTSAN
jgi:hypothetical protein